MLGAITSRRDIAPSWDPFIGREQELEDLVRQLEGGARLLTLVGAPGIGKTRLALELLRREESAVFCDLSACEDLDAVLGALSHALGGEVAASEEAIVAELETRDAAVVILDNCEQVASAVASFVEALLTRTAARFVTTSREALDVRGETRITLRRLTPEAACALFSTRATAVRSDAVGPDADLSTIARVVERLDGIPLAIELAAARVSVLSVAQIEARLDERFALLRARRSSGGERHRTLEAAIDWSWRLLDEVEQRVLAQCAVFRGGFVLAAAEAVITVPGGAAHLDVLDALQAKSLLRALPASDGDSVLRLDLLESIREYALRRLREDPYSATCAELHARWYLASGEAARQTAQDQRDHRPLEALERERANLVAAHSWGLERDAELAVRVSAVLEYTLLVRGPYNLRLQLHDAAVVAARDAQDPALEARALCLRGTSRYDEGQLDDAVDDLSRAEALALKADRLGIAANAACMLGTVRLSATGPEAAEPEYARALELARQAENLDCELRSLANLALTTAARRDFAAAQVLFEEAGRLAATVGAGGVEGCMHTNQGQLAQISGDAAAARAHFERGSAAARGGGDQFHECFATYSLGLLELELGRRREAEGQIEAARTLAQKIGDLRLEGAVRCCEGALAATGAAPEDAVAHFEAARQLFERAQDGSCLQIATLLSGLVEVAEGRPQAAARRLEDFETGREQRSPSPDEEVAARLLSLALEGALPIAPPALRAAADGAWFCVDGAEPVDIAHRTALRRLLACLLSARRDSPGETVSLEALLAAGWPEDDTVGDSGQRRVYVAISTLRGLGLAALLRTGDGGYLLDAERRVLLVT